MVKYSSTLLFLFVLTFSACQSVEQISIDYMLPAEISFPSELKKIAIINNTSSTPENKLISPGLSLKDREDGIVRAVAYSNGKATITTEALAQAIANENYFDEIVICDSALRAHDILPRENTLTKEEVVQLTEDLDVDCLITLENLQLKATKIFRYIPEWQCFQGTLDVKTYPTIRVYLPNRKGPMVTVTSNDSVFWEIYGNSETYVRTHIIQDSKAMDEASEFAGSILVKSLVPYWKTAQRYVFTNGSVDMRDAAIFVREKSWDKAFKLWEQAYQSTKSDKKKMYTALNIALYYEMKDSIEEAETWAIKAQTLARRVDHVDDKKEFVDAANFMHASLYVIELQERKSGLAKLNTQMRRFNDDF